jgi:two-component system, NarL family, nitrate/nitrite response regulator NarL
MSRVFITPTGTLRERWREAFPEARAAAKIARLTENVLPDTGSLWLDIGQLPEQFRMARVTAACALGRPVVVMVGVPAEKEAHAFLNAGAFGYCHVEATPEQLQEIATVVEHGGLWMPPGLLQRFLALSTRATSPQAPHAQPLNELTSRELMVAEQVARGASNREIAATLTITERTVKAHLSAIFEKLQVRDRVQLALKMNNIPTYHTVN